MRTSEASGVAVAKHLRQNVLREALVAVDDERVAAAIPHDAVLVRVGVGEDVVELGDEGLDAGRQVEGAVGYRGNLCGQLVAGRTSRCQCALLLTAFPSGRTSSFAGGWGSLSRGALLPVPRLALVDPTGSGTA